MNHYFKNVFYAGFCIALLGVAAIKPAFAFSQNEDISEGYALPTFKELSQTLLMMGGVDVNDVKVLDEYSKAAYCDLYLKNYKNDFEWNNIRSQIIMRVNEKKEHFRVLYEIPTVFNLGRYDFGNQVYPLTEETALKSVGSVVLLAYKDFKPFCGMKRSEVFPLEQVVQLDHPLSASKIKMPMDDAEKLLARMNEMKIPERQLFGRIRVRITEAQPPVYLYNQPATGIFKGSVKSIDLFLDREFTKWVATLDPDVRGAE
jgi:hypothetical protein